jgi:hypothetical protein
VKRKLKAYLAIVLLLALAPVLVPKSVWHHCSHEDALSHALTHANQTDHVEASCDICKVQATTYTATPAVKLPSLAIVPASYSLPLHDLVQVVPLLLLPQRGPPAC